MKKLFIALIIIGGVFTMANAQILRTLEEKEGYYPVVELKHTYTGEVKNAILCKVYTEYTDLYYKGNVYKAVPISKFIENELGWYASTVFELDGHIIETVHPNSKQAETAKGINSDNKTYRKVDTNDLFRFYDIAEDSGYIWAGCALKINKQKIGDKTYEILIGSYCYTKFGERLWVRELPE
jgi:hypothetical protein